MNRAFWHDLKRSATDAWRWVWDDSARRKTAGLIVGFVVLMLWAYAPTLGAMAQRWSDDPKYSHGFLVPIFALLVLWVRKPAHPNVVVQLSWAGIPWIVTAALMRLAAAAFYLEWLDALSILPALAGICALLGGRPALAWAWPSVLFLIFMMPAPYTLEVALAQPLQRVATRLSTYLLQTFGLPAAAEGNVIWIDDVRLGVVEACSGLGMLITFFALSTAVALILARTATERVVLFVSAIPIAVFTNVIRITLTGVLYVTAGGAVARLVYHDLAGWLMMPLALGLLWLELKFLSRLMIEPEPESPLSLTAMPSPVERRPIQAPIPQEAASVGDPGPH